MPRNRDEVQRIALLMLAPGFDALRAAADRIISMREAPGRETDIKGLTALWSSCMSSYHDALVRQMQGIRNPDDPSEKYLAMGRVTPHRAAELWEGTLEDLSNMRAIHGECVAEFLSQQAGFPMPSPRLDSTGHPTAPWTGGK